MAAVEDSPQDEDNKCSFRNRAPSNARGRTYLHPQHGGEATQWKLLQQECRQHEVVWMGKEARITWRRRSLGVAAAEHPTTPRARRSTTATAPAKMVAMTLLKTPPSSSAGNMSIKGARALKCVCGCQGTSFKTFYNCASRKRKRGDTVSDIHKLRAAYRRAHGKDMVRKGAFVPTLHRGISLHGWQHWSQCASHPAALIDRFRIHTMANCRP